MTPDRYIVIPNWDGFQHYKDRTPKWIKNYTELLSDPAYVGLTHPQRGVLHGLWLLYAESRRNIPVNTAYVSRQLSGRVSMKTLEALNHAGFIQFSASKPLAKPVPRLDRELKKKDLALEPSTANGKPAVPAVPVSPTREHRPYDQPADPAAHIRKLIGRTIHDHIDLEAELTALGINGAQADELRALLPAAAIDHTGGP